MSKGVVMRVLYIDVDSLRPDHLGCYGYHRDTSPHIDRIAHEGVRFNQCYAPDAPCLPSRTAFYAGFHEIHNTGAGGMESAEEVWPVVKRWLENNAARDNWYLHLNFWDPHT